ncbi:MAG TPA: RNA polymerase sporulation sigma factor SigH [Egibacteraceae bacterium]|nr:RNA polymerase sporulation sigma factor SigH [Egibacteraceae bacterium]
MSEALSIRPASPTTQSDEELVRNAWSGDDSALETLLQRYRNFVRMKARSYFLVGADREDVVQEGMIGLYKAIRDYDPSREASFRGFAELCITRQIITAIKTATRQKHAPLNSYVSLYLPAYTDDEPDHEIVEQFVSDAADPADSVVSSQELAVLEEYFGDILSDLEAEVLQRYIEGQSYQEIAVELDRHVKSIDNALQRIKRKLDAYLENRRLTEAV